jgi:RNA polymerase sigma factor (sigma-70 family)
LTDQEIFDGIARKDNRVFLHLYETYQPRILRLVRQNQGSEADASDLFQEGLVALWTNIASGKFELRENARLSTYFYALCRNLWISKLRRRQTVQSLDAEDSALELAAEVDELTAHHDRIRQLEASLAQLGDNCRRLLKLFYYQKASLREIAATLGITEPTAKNNKYRCMQRLRAKSRDHYSSESTGS